MNVKGSWLESDGAVWRPATHDISHHGNNYCNSHDSARTAIHPWVCSNIGLQSADKALTVTFPNTGATVVWAVGLLAAGQMSTLTGTRAGQYIMEGFVKIKISKWKRVLLTRSVALIPAVAFALLSADKPSIGDTMNQWLNILQSVQLPFALLPLLHFTNQDHIMGPFKNSLALRCLCWILAGLVIGVNFFLLYWTIKDASLLWYELAIVFMVATAYTAFILAIVGEDMKGGYAYIKHSLAIRCHVGHTCSDGANQGLLRERNPDG